MKTLPDFFSSPFPLPPFEPPDWVIAETHNRIVLLLNHVLQQEPQAMQRLAQHRHQIIQLGWQTYSLRLSPSAVGLLTVAPATAKPDLLLEIMDTPSPALAQKLLRGEKPQVRIEGDIQLAAQVQWLIQNVRWDLEGDLARLVGDVPAHYLVKAAKMLQANLKQWLGQRQA